MNVASASELQTYLADIVERLEFYAVTLLPPNDAKEIALGSEADGGLVIALECRLPADRRSKDVELELFERWRPTGTDEWTSSEYRYELRHHQLQYRRAFHHHHEGHCVRAYGVATHEHCEVTMGVATCNHYDGRPVRDAFDAFGRLYGLWLTNEKPDCSELTCLEPD